MSEELFSEETHLAEYDTIEAALTKFKANYEGQVFDVTTTKGMESAKHVRFKVRRTRTDLEKVRKAIKAPALARCKLIDSEAKRLTTAIMEIEQPIDDLIKEEEARKAEIKAEKERVERERVEEIQGCIIALGVMPSPGANSTEIRRVLEKRAEVEVGDEYAEYKEQAQKVLGDAITSLQALLIETEEREEAEAAAKAEREADARRLAEERKSLDEEKATLAKEAAELEGQKLKVALEAREREKEQIDKEVADKLAPVMETIVEHGDLYYGELTEDELSERIDIIKEDLDDDKKTYGECWETVVRVVRETLDI